MIKQNYCSYLLPLNPVFNQEDIPLFESMDKEHSSVLWSALYLNSYEVLSSHSTPFIMILDERDRSFVPEIIKDCDNIFYGDTCNKEMLLRGLNDKYFGRTENNIIFLSKSIGYTLKDIVKVFNLLNSGDDSLVLGKSTSNKICFAGFNVYPGFFENGVTDYDNVLTQSCRRDSYLYTIDNFISLDSAADFKKLYNELSKKESLSYCSQDIHEMFTHLFIEYKDLLK